VTDLYKYGVQQALRDLGFNTEKFEKGTPFPAKSPRIAAERLADVLQQQSDDVPEHIGPENKQPGVLGRPVTWGAPVSLRGIDAGHGTAGLMSPYSMKS